MAEKGPGQAAVGDGDEQQLRERGRNRKPDPALNAETGPGKRHQGLGKGNTKGNYQGKLADFRYHC